MPLCKCRCSETKLKGKLLNNLLRKHKDRRKGNLLHKVKEDQDLS